MTYFTDSVYEKMMMQNPKKGREKKTPVPNGRKWEERDKSNKEPIPNTKEGSMKENEVSNSRKTVRGTKHCHGYWC